VALNITIHSFIGQLASNLKGKLKEIKMGGGGSSGTSGTSGTNLYTWKDILPPWIQSGQKAALPYLMSRAQTGLLPSEERSLWGGVKGSLESGSMGAGKELSRMLASSGISANSPAAAGGFADLASDKVTATSKAALDFAKTKIGARDTSIGQLLTALYTPPPVATSQWSNQTGGGGK
jgi:hypothetical protein